MTIAESFFGKRIDLITKEDLETYFSSERKEGINIEYKSYRDDPREGGSVSERNKRKYNKIFEAISAFLNTGGGILIWGAPTGHILPGDTEESYSGSLTEVPFVIAPDAFYNKIATDITPIPVGISFKSILISEDMFCYIFEVTQSESTPHQHKGTYFIRVGASTHTAPHALVEAMIKKITFPKLEGYMTFGQPAFRRGFTLIPCAIFIYNQSNFIQEKNLEYRMIAHGCDFRDLGSRHTTPFIYERDFTISAKPILHKSVPFFKEYILVIPRSSQPGHLTHIQLLLSFWGERSPAISCSYNLFITVEDIGAYSVSMRVEKMENKYLYQTREEIERSGAYPGLEVVHNQVIESLQRNLPESEFYNSLS